ncbi:MAG TPA: alkaline phosphatase [Thermoanaerobaculia bacterium]
MAAVLLAATAPAAPKNIILLIADGSGLGHFTLARNLRGEAYNIGRMPVIGVFTTQCADRAVTDSAAAATTFATGAKTNYEMLSVDPKTLAPLETVLEIAEKQGKKTGLVTTAAFFDATPAAFAAHAKHRHDKGVDLQMLRSGTDVIVGTLLDDPGEEQSPELVAVAKENGYTVVDTRQELDAAPHGKKVLAIFPWQERNLDQPDAPLPVLAKWAIDHLDGDPDGFFLMIEQEGTDSSSHQNQIPDLRKALVSFDEAVGVALDYAAKHGDTLVIATADHETGGLRVTETAMLRKLRVEWSTTEHTGTMLPLFAYGPGSIFFGGIQDNTDVGKKLKAAVLAKP